MKKCSNTVQIKLKTDVFFSNDSISNISYLLQLPMLYTRTLTKKQSEFYNSALSCFDSTVMACCGNWDYAKRTLLKLISADNNWHIVCCNVVKTSLNLMNLDIMMTKRNYRHKSGFKKKKHHRLSKPENGRPFFK